MNGGMPRYTNAIISAQWREEDVRPHEASEGNLRNRRLQIRTYMCLHVGMQNPILCQEKTANFSIDFAKVESIPFCFFKNSH